MPKFTEPKLLFKWIGKYRLCENDYDYTLSNPKNIGKWFHQKGKIEVCNNGFHACTLRGINYWRDIYSWDIATNKPDSDLWLVEVKGSYDFDKDDNKFAVEYIRFIRQLKIHYRSEGDNIDTVRIAELKKNDVNQVLKTTDAIKTCKEFLEELNKKTEKKIPELLPCPFCGETYKGAIFGDFSSPKVGLMVYPNAPNSDTTPTDHVCCLNCGAGMPSVEKWNSRKN